MARKRFAFLGDAAWETAIYHHVAENKQRLPEAAKSVPSFLDSSFQAADIVPAPSF